MGVSVMAFRHWCFRSPLDLHLWYMSVQVEGVGLSSQCMWVKLQLWYNSAHHQRTTDGVTNYLLFAVYRHNVVTSEALGPGSVLLRRERERERENPGEEGCL